MGCNNLLVGYHALHSVVKAYGNVINAIAKFVYPTPPTNIITNENILTQYSIKQVIKVFGKKARLEYKNNCSSFLTAEFLI